MTTSPLGKYASLAALIGAATIIAVWAIQHIFGISDPEVDKAFLIALGVLLGTGAIQQQAVMEAANHLNGTQEAIAALTLRVKAIADNLHKDDP